MLPLHLHGQMSWLPGSFSERQIRQLAVCRADSSLALPSFNRMLPALTFVSSDWDIFDRSFSGGPPVHPPLIAVGFFMTGTDCMLFYAAFLVIACCRWGMLADSTPSMMT